MKLNELKIRKNELVEEVEKLSKEEFTDETRSRLDEIESTIDQLNKDIERAEFIQKTKMAKVEVETEEEEKRDEAEISMGVEFRDFLTDAIEKGGKQTFSLRADPVLASTETTIINKAVANSMDIMVSPGESFLRTLGVSFYPGLTGNFVVPYMAQDTATFPGEDASAASADMDPESLTLAARRVTHRQKISKETLAQTNPAIYAGIVQNLVNGVWNAVANDVFDTIETDAVSRATTPTAAGLAYGDVVNMEASIGGLDIGRGAFVTTPAGRGYMKQTVETTYGPAIWNDDQVCGYPAYAVPAANAGAIYFGDFSKCCIGQWGGFEIIVDPYSDARKGLINLTIVGLVDTGVANTRGLVWGDASMGV